MALPDLRQFCVQLTVYPALCVQLPGGAKVCAKYPSATIPSQAELMSALLAQVNSSLTPLVPFFDILDVLVAMVNCVKAVEKCLGPPPDPTELIKCFPKLAQAMATLLKLLPQLSIPVLIADVLDVLIAYLRGVRGQLLAFIMKEIRILAAQTYVYALGSIQLQASIDCATEDLHAAMLNMNEGASAIGKLVELVNLLLGIAGLPELPLGIADLAADAQASLLPIDAAIKVLTTVRGSFP